jgi:hypothetical protein
MLRFLLVVAAALVALAVTSQERMRPIAIARRLRPAARGSRSR